MAEQSVNLDHIDRFSGLSDRDVAKIAKAGTYITVPADWALMGEGTSADKAYLLISGEVSVRKDGKEVATLGPGDIFGEMGIVNHKLRSATVISLSRLECLHFTREKLIELEEQIPEFREALEASARERAGESST
jgi:CRP/FNR family transcriptional regulator, cyclic AMP receptor protein